MNEYVEKEELIAIIEALPVTNFNGIEMCPKNHILKATEFLPASKITTKMRRNHYNQVYCQSCNKVIPLPCWEIERLGNCPYCGFKIEECIF